MSTRPSSAGLTTGDVLMLPGLGRAQPRSPARCLPGAEAGRRGQGVTVEIAGLKQTAGLVAGRGSGGLPHPVIEAKSVEIFPGRCFLKSRRGLPVLEQQATAACLPVMLPGATRKGEQANVPSCSCSAFQHRGYRRDLGHAPDDQLAKDSGGQRCVGPNSS